MPNVQSIFNWFNPWEWQRHRAKKKLISDFEDAANDSNDDDLLHSLRGLQALECPAMDQSLALGLFKKLITEIPVNEQEKFLGHIDNNNYQLAIKYLKYQAAIDKLYLHRDFSRNLQDFNKTKSYKKDFIYIAVVSAIYFTMPLLFNPIIGIIALATGILISGIGIVDYLRESEKHAKHTATLQKTIKKINNQPDATDIDISVDTLAKIITQIDTDRSQIQTEFADQIAELPEKQEMLRIDPPNLIQQMTWQFETAQRKTDFRAAREHRSKDLLEASESPSTNTARREPNTP